MDYWGREWSTIHREGAHGWRPYRPLSRWTNYSTMHREGGWRPYRGFSRWALGPHASRVHSVSRETPLHAGSVRSQGSSPMSGRLAPNFHGQWRNPCNRWLFFVATDYTRCSEPGAVATRPLCDRRSEPSGFFIKTISNCLHSGPKRGKLEPCKQF